MRCSQITATTFFIPVIVAIVYKRWPDVIVLSIQGCTSYIHHSHYTQTTLIIDRAAIFALTLRSLYIAVQSYYTMALVIVSYGYLCIMYIYGFYNKCFSFDSREIVADRYHASTHIVGIFIYSGSMIWFLE
jgi:hypothetical protein